MNKAVDMLVNNRVPSEDAFDILASFRVDAVVVRTVW